MKPHDVDIGHYNNMVEQFHKETDRAAAVLAGCFLENYLAVFLKAFFVDYDDAMFDGFGPLSSFAQRSSIAMATGLVDRGILEQLDAIRHIRNHFAHHPFDANFNDAVLAKYFDKLPSSKDPSFNTKGDGKPLTDRKWIYLLSIGLIVTNMNVAITRKRHEDSTAKQSSSTEPDKKA
jgi:hypothetical protein